jgi:hypothetical protein
VVGGQRDRKALSGRGKVARPRPDEAAVSREGNNGARAPEGQSARGAKRLAPAAHRGKAAAPQTSRRTRPPYEPRDNRDHPADVAAHAATPRASRQPQPPCRRRGARGRPRPPGDVSGTATYRPIGSSPPSARPHRPNYDPRRAPDRMRRRDRTLPSTAPGHSPLRASDYRMTCGAMAAPRPRLRAGRRRPPIVRRDAPPRSAARRAAQAW